MFGVSASASSSGMGSASDIESSLLRLGMRAEEKRRRFPCLALASSGGVREAAPAGAAPVSFSSAAAAAAAASFLFLAFLNMREGLLMPRRTLVWYKKAGIERILKN